MPDASHGPVSWTVQQQLPALPKYVLLTIALLSGAEEHGEFEYATSLADVDDLVQVTGLSERHVREAVAFLTERGHLRPLYEAGGWGMVYAVGPARRLSGAA